MDKLSPKQVNWFFQLTQLDKGRGRTESEFSDGQFSVYLYISLLNSQ